MLIYKWSMVGNKELIYCGHILKTMPTALFKYNTVHQFTELDKHNTSRLLALTATILF